MAMRSQIPTSLHVQNKLQGITNIYKSLVYFNLQQSHLPHQLRSQQIEGQREQVRCVLPQTPLCHQNLMQHVKAHVLKYLGP